MVHNASNGSMMAYVSTRQSSPEVSFEEALLAGLAPDGGLYMPSSWPKLEQLDEPARAKYETAAAAVMAPYTGENPDVAELSSLVARAYSQFAHPDIAPLKEIGPDLFLLELFHGPTFAFKDFAMQVLSLMMERALNRKGMRTTILGATSGDTGAAAVEAFRGRKDIELFILFPHGRISDVQRRQMTTAAEGNIHAIAIEGTFDDAQTIVKSLFGDAEFRARHALSAINSINWARIIAQAVYYFTSAAKLRSAIPPSFTVPTGNFGDIFAGYAAHKMGLPLDKLVIATNENDILARTLATGRYEPRAVFASDSPSMDIQISSNFERLLFEASGRDAGFIQHAMSRLRDQGAFDIPKETLATIRNRFSAHRVTRDEAAAAMRALYDEMGYLADPHTAVGLAAAKKELASAEGKGPMVVLSTAHPAKFPDAVRRATGQTPECPEKLRRCLTGEERFTVLPNSAAEVANYIRNSTT